jgi:hypothetical protein
MVFLKALCLKLSTSTSLVTMTALALFANVNGEFGAFGAKVGDSLLCTSALSTLDSRSPAAVVIFFLAGKAEISVMVLALREPHLEGNRPEGKVLNGMMKSL